MDLHPRCLSSLSDLTDAASLSSIVGPVDDVQIEPLHGVGYSNASLSLVHVMRSGIIERTFVLKRTQLDEDWTARRSGDDRGREALLLAEPMLAPVWDIFASPYVAWASEAKQIGLLLRDLTAGLLPDVRAPLSVDQELALLSALTELHARFWDDRRLTTMDWLMRASSYCDILAPSVASDRSALAVLAPSLQVDVPRGWGSALPRLTPGVARHLTCPGLDWERRWADLPRTLLHGDVKVANFALLPGERVAAFDWALVGTGPCTIDLGWYLAVNASRLTSPKDQIVSGYRALLETALGQPLRDSLWARLKTVAIVCGARMLLWSKALGLDARRAGAEEDWEWWVDRLADLRIDSAAV